MIILVILCIGCMIFLNPDKKADSHTNDTASDSKADETIVAWLINYMLRFIMEKRSREFGIYLLLGMGKRQIAQLYMRENMLLGAAAFLVGLMFGMLVQQILMAVLYSMILMEYRLDIELDGRCIAMTALCYAGCYLLALLRCRRKLKKMNIHGLMNAERQNEEIRESREGFKKWFLPYALRMWILPAMS